MGANSRLLLADNTIYWIGDRRDAVRPTGPFDPQLPVLAFRDGYTHQELAERLHAPLGSIKSWIRRGQIQLKECLDR